MARVLACINQIYRSVVEAAQREIHRTIVACGNRLDEKEAVRAGAVDDYICSGKNRWRVCDGFEGRV